MPGMPTNWVKNIVTILGTPKPAKWPPGKRQSKLS